MALSVYPYIIQIGLQLLPNSGNGEEHEIKLTVQNHSLTWSTSQENYTDTSPIGNLSNWFSLTKNDGSGAISSVFYPSQESKAVLAFKKSLSQLLSVRTVVNRTLGQGGHQVVREEVNRQLQGHTVALTKVSTSLAAV